MILPLGETYVRKIYWRQVHSEDLKVFIVMVSYPLTKIN
uniref:Orf69 n=1 Tax=Serratia marcescens TaxID=615 RepID=A0A7S6YK84_SERMA|nr:Orf69 [Serratia marcescens]